MFGISTGNTILDITLIVGIVVLIIVSVLKLLGIEPGGNANHYTRRQNLLTSEELRFYKVLNEYINNRAAIFVQIRLADIFAVKKNIDKKEYHGKLNRITSKSVDFVICEKETLKILFAIELDDKSHECESRKQRDVFVNKLFSDNELPLIRIQTQKKYSVDSINEQINQYLPQ